MGQDLSSSLFHQFGPASSPSSNQNASKLRRLTKSHFNKIVHEHLSTSPVHQPPKSYLFVDHLIKSSTSQQQQDLEKIFKPQKITQTIPNLGLLLEMAFLRDGTISGTAFWKSNYLSSVLIDHEHEEKRIAREEKRKMKRESEREEREEMIRLGLELADDEADETPGELERAHNNRHLHNNQNQPPKNNNINNNSKSSIERSSSATWKTDYAAKKEAEKNAKSAQQEIEIQIPIRGKFFISEHQNFLCQVELVFGVCTANHDQGDETTIVTSSFQLFWNRFDGKLHPLRDSATIIDAQNRDQDDSFFSNNFRVEILPDIIIRRKKKAKLLFHSVASTTANNNENDTDNDPETPIDKQNREKREDFEQVQKFLPEQHRRHRMSEREFDSTSSSDSEGVNNQNNGNDVNLDGDESISANKNKNSSKQRSLLLPSPSITSNQAPQDQPQNQKLTPTQTAMIMALDALINELGADVSSTVSVKNNSQQLFGHNIPQELTEEKAATTTNKRGLTRVDSKIHHNMNIHDNSSTSNAASALTRQSTATHLGAMMVMSLENNQLINNDPAQVASPILFLKALESKRRLNHDMNGGDDNEEIGDVEGDDGVLEEIKSKTNNGNDSSSKSPKRTNKNDDGNRVFSPKTRLKNQQCQKRRMFHRLGGTWDIPNDEAALRKIFATFDIDNSNYIDKKEFIECYVEFESEMMGLSEAIEGGNILGDLANYDHNENNNNNISAGSLMKMSGSLLGDSASISADGSNAASGKKRMVSMISTTKKALRGDALAYFEKFDKNRDEKLSFAEFQLFMLHRAND